MPIAALIPALLPLLGSALDRIFPDPAERERAKAALLEAETAGRLAELNATLAAIVAEAQSPDPWTSRARPTFLYVIYLAILACFAGALLGVWWPAQVTQAATNLGQLLTAIPDDLWYLFGAGYLGYSASRSFDKWRGQGRGR